MIEGNSLVAADMEMATTKDPEIPFYMHFWGELLQKKSVFLGNFGQELSYLCVCSFLISFLLFSFKKVL